jgi:hypothetical protein
MLLICGTKNVYRYNAMLYHTKKEGGVMSGLEKAELLFYEGKIEESLSLIRSEIEISGETDALLLLMAKNQYKLQAWGDCLNCLNKILEHDENNQAAKNYKQMVMNIISFWNKDSFNP